MMRMRLLQALVGLTFFFAASSGQAEEPSGKERVEADVSARSVAITSSFTGTQIIVFGTVENSVQPSAEAGTYDVIVTAEGVAAPAVVHKKSRIGGLWINTRTQRFASLPSYYAIASTRPIEEITDRQILEQNGIGFDHIKIVTETSDTRVITDEKEARAFQDALIELKQRDRLYVQSNFGVTFIGRSLFRATISLPPNVPVGPLQARVYLFKDGKLLSNYSSTVALQREGVERYIHDAALHKPLRYGLVTVLMAVLAGLGAAFWFRKLA